MPTPDELLRSLRGIAKKHGATAEVAVKYRTAAGKTKTRRGLLVGVREDRTVGLRNEAWSSDWWTSIDVVVDAWKKGTDRSG